MNKQQLASKIWESANKMRSKIEANEYKDYILGFIFYKFLSENEVKFLKDTQFYEDKDIKKLKEKNKNDVIQCQNAIGYFISYDNLFSTWLAMGKDFNVSNVRDALSAFERNISESHKKLFHGIFDTLQTGLSKLGDTASKQTSAIYNLISLIKDIPMDGKQDYDVLGFIYEYLISNFAANAGKKAGEFYTPHEVSLLMSEIVANHLKSNKEISIYDPTSGSGSLLINIGKSISKFIGNANNIKYYAQELKENTYNLTRMNLVMRGIIPSNINTRCGDTLEEDWPIFDEDDPVGTYHFISVDAVVSNPPYSQNWDPKDKENDPRYKDYGLAPKKKADYAFLLHDLYHIKPKGIMTIVLPHGVLFRGGDEAEIRKNLIENDKIDAIIGLPSNIFFGTGIPTIIMVLKQKRDNNDVLIIDASKGYEKVGKNNKLRSSDIKKIVDAIIDRKNIEKFAKVVSKEEIRKNDYNLNISRYVDSSDEEESYDLFSSMFGGIPDYETKKYDNAFSEFKTLKSRLFKNVNENYFSVNAKDIDECINSDESVKKYIEKFIDNFKDYDKYLNDEIIGRVSKINIQKEKEILADDLFERFKNINLIDKYKAYQILSDYYEKIAVDLEIIQTEGFNATKKVDPNMVIKKKDGIDIEVQDGWVGHILPFDIVQNELLKKDIKHIESFKNRIDEIEENINELVENLSIEDAENVLNEDKTEFVKNDLDKNYKKIIDSLEINEERILDEYISLSKNDKIEFTKNHKEIEWNKMEKNKDGTTYGKTTINKYINFLKLNYNFAENSFEYIVKKAINLIDEKKMVSDELKVKNNELIEKTIKTIQNLTDKQVKELLYIKWIKPIVSNINNMPNDYLIDFTEDMKKLASKYDYTYESIENDIKETSKEIREMLKDLQGNEFDMKGINELKELLNGK